MTGNGFYIPPIKMVLGDCLWHCFTHIRKTCGAKADSVCSVLRTSRGNSEFSFQQDVAGFRSGSSMAGFL